MFRSDRKSVRAHLRAASGFSEDQTISPSLAGTHRASARLSLLPFGIVVTASPYGARLGVAG